MNQDNLDKQNSPNNNNLNPLNNQATQVPDFYKNIQNTDAFEAQSPEPYNTPEKVPNNKPNKKLFIVASIILIIILLVIVGAIYYLSQKQKSSEQSAIYQKIKIEPNFLSAQTTIEHINEGFAGEPKAAHTILLPIKLSSYKFYTKIPDNEYTAISSKTTSNSNIDAEYKKITKSLEKDGFLNIETKYSLSNTKLALFNRLNQTYCQTSITPVESARSTSTIEVVCADTNTYEKYAEQQVFLARVYTPITSSGIEYVFIGKPVSRPGGVKDYSTIEISSARMLDNQNHDSPKQAVFYKSPDGLPHYVTDRDSDVMYKCDFFSKSAYPAFVGERCKKENGDIINLPAKKTY